MHMLAESLPPGVQHSRHAQLTIQAFGVASKPIQRAPYGLEQQPIDQLRMQLHPTIELMRQGEHHMMIGHR